MDLSILVLSEGIHTKANPTSNPALSGGKGVRRWYLVFSKTCKYGKLLQSCSLMNG